MLDYSQAAEIEDFVQSQKAEDMTQVLADLVAQLKLDFVSVVVVRRGLVAFADIVEDIALDNYHNFQKDY